MRNTTNLKQAKKEKNDEFYTQLSDIEKELVHYTKHFKDKIIYCNCDDYRASNFYKYFKDNFDNLQLKKLISTGYKKDSNGIKCIFDGKTEISENLKGDGSFKSDECISILKESDIVVTNPPFSLFRKYIAQLVEYDKKLLVIGNMNAISYKEIFQLIKENKLWCGFGFNLSMVYKSPYKNTLEANRKFVQSKGYDPDNHIKVPAVCWYTNLDHDKRYKELILYKKYNSEEYPKYDNHDAINVNKVVDIPMDYDGVMGVPITFIDKYNPDQFEILDCCEPCINIDTFKECDYFRPYKSRQIIYNGRLCQKTYHRLLIRRIKK